MRKVTKRLLTVGVAVLVLGACQDSVTVVQPPPPPPPPPPPMVDATVTIQGLRTIPGNAPVNPTAVAGDINVVLNVEEGTNTVTDVDLTVNGVPIGCQNISTNEVPGEGVALSEAGADVVECFFNTDDVVGTCDGNQLPPAFPNGTHTLGATITLSDATTRTASNEQQITLVNTDFLALVHVQGQAVVSGGVTYFGGPADLDGDGTDDNLNQFAVCPVSYLGTTVASLGLQGIQPLTTPVDLGAGGGVIATDAAAPFVFDADPTDNDLASGNAVEDDVTTFGILAGHTISTAGTILDSNGLNVTAQFAPASIGPVFLDFTSPQPNMGGATEILVGGASVLSPVWYSTGAFSLTFVTEDGVGWSFGNGASVDVGDCATAANNDASSATAFVPTFSGAAGISDHTEDDWELGGDGFAGTDAGGVDCYLAELQALADDLMNAFDLTTLGAMIQTADDYGSDQTEGVESMVQPASNVVLNPSATGDNGTCPVLGDCTVMFEVDDPVLASGDPGSGTDYLGVTATDEGGGGLGVAFTAPDMISVDISTLADGPHTVTPSVDDFATPPNNRQFDIDFDLDDTAPTHGALNPAPVGGQTAATAIVFTIGGTINDAHIIDSAVLSVWISDGNTTCGEATDTKLPVGSAQDEIDRNDVDLTDGTNAISFNESFTVQEITGGTGVQNYCFLITAEDEAVLKDGTDTGNSSSLGTFITVDWL